MVAPEDDDRRVRTDRLLRVAAGVLFACTLLQAGTQLRAAWAFDTDDAFITLRYARNWVEGAGIVWNPGEERPVEGYSNFSFLLIAAAALRLGVDPLLTLKLAGAASLLATCVVLYVLARRWLGPVGSTLPGLALVAYPGTAFWAVSGLETATYQLLVTGAVLAFVRGAEGERLDTVPKGAAESRRSRWSLAAAGILTFLASITRPEAPLVFAVLASILVVRAFLRRRQGAAIRPELVPVTCLVSTFLLPYACFIGWRFSHFERLVPNTVLCKRAWTGDPYALIVPFALHAWPLAACAVFARRGPGFLAIWGITVLYVAALVGADPVVGAYNRHFMAVYALLLVLAASGATSVLARLPRLGRDGAESLVALVMALVTFDRLPELERLTRYEAHQYAMRQRMRADVAHLIDRTLPHDAAFVVGDAGLTAYLARRRVIDPYCLNSREMTEPPIEHSMERFVAWTLAQEPEAIVIPSRHPTVLKPREGYGFFRRLLENEGFAQYELAARVEDPGGEFNSFVFVRRPAPP